jgi:16S rRNA (guanine(1405)-N(7))-methyltransferase
VLDIGCGLNPLAIPWMGLPATANYTCCDIDAGLVDFLNDVFTITGVPGRAEVRNVISHPPKDRFDLVLALKLLPTLDQLQRGAGNALLRHLAAPRLIVSFPAHSLGGRDKGMPATYEARFRALAESEGWRIRTFTYPSEIAFQVSS